MIGRGSSCSRGSVIHDRARGSGRRGMRHGVQGEAGSRLRALEMLPIGDNHGPETIALDAEGRIYATTHEGRIVRLRSDGSNPENWVTTGGRPLGIRFDIAGNLLVADALRGLLRVAPDGAITTLATEADGK